MIVSTEEYRQAQDELEQLECLLARLQRDNPVPEKGLTKAGVRNMIARLHEELAVYEGRRELLLNEPQ